MTTKKKGFFFLEGNSPSLSPPHTSTVDSMVSQGYCPNQREIL